MSNFFIVALDKQGGIAKDHKIPWHYPEDFQFFKDKTKGYSCIMGYNTFKEIAEMRKYPHKNGELLPGRSCYVVTSHDIETNNHVSAISSLESLDSYNWSRAYIGGKSVYDYAMKNPNVRYGYITRIDEDYSCDTFFDEELLKEYFDFSYTIKTVDKLKFQKWVRKYENF